MQTKDTLTPPELDAIVRNLPTEVLLGAIPTKKWKRVDVGMTEVYVGDELYIVALVEKMSESIDEITSNQVNTEETVIKYLQSEGFIGKDYAYVGMQRFNLQKPPEGFTNDEES
jgi:hypothetical protein